MKKIGLLGVLLFCGQMSFAQAWQGKGDQKAQVGFSGYGNGTGLTATYDYGISNILSLGAGVNFYTSGYKDDQKTFLFGRVNAHLQEPLNLSSKWDIYPGLDLGVLGNTFDLGAHIGVRYFFTNNIGAFIEAGNNGSIGVTFNF